MDRIGMPARIRISNSNLNKFKAQFSYNGTYDLYGPVSNAFDAGSIHHEGKWEGVS